MSIRSQFLSFWPYALTAAVLYSIPMAIFVHSANFNSIYFLYMGNAFFLAGIVFFLYRYNKKRADDASGSSMVIAGHITTAIGILMSCILALLVIFIFIPNILQPEIPDKVLQNANPSQPAPGKTHGLLLIIFMNAIIGNLCTGSFTSIILPYSLKKNQTKDKASEFVNIRKIDKD